MDISWNELPLTALVSYGFLYLSVVLLWFPGKRILPRWFFSLVAAIFLGLISHQLEVRALTPVMIFFLAVYLRQHKKSGEIVRATAWVIVLFLGYTLLKHLVPGFHRLILLNQVYISKDAAPFSLSLDFSKPLVGVFLLAFTAQLIKTKRECLVLLKQVFKYAPLLIFVIILTALRYHLVWIDVKWPHDILLWSIVNLLCVSVAEEAYYRGFIQKQLAGWMSKIKYGNYIAILLAAFLFGLDHLQFGMNYVAVAAAAGFCYGWIYYTTKRIEGSILTHFLLNLTHFLFFTYPFLLTPH